MSKLTNNTEQLESLLAKVNALPEAGGGTNTSDATATADEIFVGETAYTADGKVTGTFTIESELTEQNDLISQIATLVSTKANPQGGTDTSDATATSNDILSGKTAYVNGEKITGTIATKTSSNLTASGATVTVPAGYYASNATKSIASGSAKTPATTITTNPNISVGTNGKITAYISNTQNVTPTVSAGYVSSGTAGTITVSGSTTMQLTTQAAKTITPSTSSQTAVAKDVYTTGEITVAAIPSNYEDVGSETTAYTNKLATLETAITALETELQGKASGGSGGGSIETCKVTTEGSNGNLLVIGTCINDAGEIYGISEKPNDEEITQYTFVKNTVIAFLDKYWSIIPNGVISTGASDMGRELADGVAMFILDADTATFTFAS